MIWKKDGVQYSVEYDAPNLRLSVALTCYAAEDPTEEYRWALKAEPCQPHQVKSLTDKLVARLLPMQREYFAGINLTLTAQPGKA